MALIESYLQTFLEACVGISIHGFELVGVFIIIAAGVKGLVNFVRKAPTVGAVEMRPVEVIGRSRSALPSNAERA